MSRSPCEKCTHKMTPKNEMPCAACPDPAEYAESLGHPSLPTRTIKEMVKTEPYKPTPKEPEPIMSNILKKVFKPCPGPLHNGENLPLDKFSKSTATVDGRSKICIECQKIELAGIPIEEKKRRGMPKGGWPKKNLPEPTTSDADISKKTPSPMPEAGPIKNTPLKFDLSAFKKITFDRRVMCEPMIRIGGKNEISFNVCASNEYKLMECKSFDVYMDKNEARTAIVFIPRNDTDGTFKAQYQPSYCYFNSIKLIRELSVSAGRYPVKMVDGALVVEVPYE